MKQSTALEILKTGVSVFLTGEPGSGKTYIINEYIKYLRSKNEEPAITASTGIAATHIGGQTIHSWCGLGIKHELNDYDLHKIAKNKRIQLNIVGTKVLIIDEISMLTGDTLVFIDTICRKVKNNSRPFGGMQVIFSGDFFQLPPVSKIKKISDQTTFIEEPSSIFAYNSSIWQQINPTICYLTEQYRQDDTNYSLVLSSIRCKSFNDENLKLLKTRLINPKSLPENVTKLYSHNEDVDFINSEILEKIQNELHVFTMREEGLPLLVKQIKAGCLSPERLELKIGAKVMFTKNNPGLGFVNGTMGEIIKFNKIDGFPVVKLSNNSQIKAEPMDWTIEQNDKVIAKVTQIPLRLAWAITVHKSQGMTLEEAVVDLSKAFEYGQGYVALSRLRSLSGLYLIGWSNKASEINPEVFAKDVEFKKRSNEVENDQALFVKQKNIYRLIKPINNEININPQKYNKPIKKYSINEIRKKYPNAYTSWDKFQDEQLKKLFKSGLSTKSLVVIFQRNGGAIRSRLKKLGLLK